MLQQISSDILRLHCTQVYFQRCVTFNTTLPRKLIYSRQVSTHCRRYRYVAYWQFMRWMWGQLSKGERKVIPSCAVSRCSRWSSTAGSNTPTCKKYNCTPGSGSRVTSRKWQNYVAFAERFRQLGQPPSRKHDTTSFCW